MLLRQYYYYYYYPALMISEECAAEREAGSAWGQDRGKKFIAYI
jgi:hypothetical protein